MKCTLLVGRMPTNEQYQPHHIIPSGKVCGKEVEKVLGLACSFGTYGTITSAAIQDKEGRVFLITKKDGYRSHGWEEDYPFDITEKKAKVADYLESRAWGGYDNGNGYACLVEEYAA